MGEFVEPRWLASPQQLNVDFLSGCWGNGQREDADIYSAVTCVLSLGAPRHPGTSESWFCFKLRVFSF